MVVLDCTDAVTIHHEERFIHGTNYVLTIDTCSTNSTATVAPAVCYRVRVVRYEASSCITTITKIDNRVPVWPWPWPRPAFYVTPARHYRSPCALKSTPRAVGFRAARADRKRARRTQQLAAMLICN